MAIAACPFSCLFVFFVAPESGLAKPELRETLVIAALTPEEQALHTAD